MDWQYPATIGIITVAALYVLRALLRPLLKSAKTGCGSGCGKCATSATEEAKPGRIRLPQV